MRLKKKQEKEAAAKNELLSKYREKIADVQTRPYISVAEASVFFGISKDTVRRLCKSGGIMSYNFGQRLTRVSRQDLEKLFEGTEISENAEENSPQYYFEVGNCYTITEASQKFHADPSTIYKAIKRYNIPTKKVGSFVYVPKTLMDNILSLLFNQPYK